MVQLAKSQGWSAEQIRETPINLVEEYSLITLLLSSLEFYIFQSPPFTVRN